MNREIKFRAWYYNKECPEYSYMTFVCSIDFVKRKAKIGVFEKICKFDQIELMQYTGLKDKNSVEIYEGDIVEVDDEICTIIWDELYVTYAISSKEYGNEDLGNFESKVLKVIGNIYENPELLGGE